MGTLLDALSQENLDNQREVVKNEKRWSYDNRPYGSWNEKILGHLFPEEHPYHHPTIGSMEDLDAASLEDVKAFFRHLLRAEQRGADRRRRLRPRRGPRAGSSSTSAPIPANPDIPPLPDMSLPPILGERDPRDRSRTACRCRGSTSGFRAPVFGDHAPRRARPRRPAPRRRQGQPAASPARPRRAARPGRRGVHARRSSAAPRSCVGWATVRPGVDLDARRGGLPEELERIAPRARRATTSSTAPRR